MNKAASGLDQFFRNFSKNHPVASTALTFGSIGAGGAALAGLIRELSTAIEEKKKKEKLEHDGVDPNTIVLHVPKKVLKSKSAEAGECDGCADPEICSAQKSNHDRVVRRESLVQRETIAGSHATSGFQRDLHGQFTGSGCKMAANDGVLTRTKQIFAGVGGLTAGFMLVKKLHERLEQKRLKDQIEAAQKEYLDLIQGSSKYASVRELFLCDDPVYGSSTEKRAGVIKDILNIPDNASKLSATALASYIAMALGAGYVTKKVLHDKFDEEEQDEEPPKVNRILFKTSSDETFEVDPGSALASIGVMMDCIRDSHDPMSKQAADYRFLDKVVATPEGKQWLLDVYAQSQGLKRNVSGRDLPGLSTMDKLKYARTLRGLERDPSKHMAGVRGYVLNLMKQDPRAWFNLVMQQRNWDLVRSMANNTFVSALSDGELSNFAQLPEIGQALSGKGATKSAQSLDQLTSLLSRSKVLSDKSNVDLDKKLDQILESLPEGGKRRKKKNSVPKTKVVASDPEAEEFVLKNNAQLADIIRSLKEQGLVA